MSYVKILIHAVWSTKNRTPYLNGIVLPLLINHIKEQALLKGMHIDRINGHVDHIHVLMWLRADMSIGKVIQLIKGESSYWMNQQKIIPVHFAWSREYFAGSVSPSGIAKVRAYIDQQANHHHKTSFLEEYKEFMDIFEEEQG